MRQLGIVSVSTDRGFQVCRTGRDGHLEGWEERWRDAFIFCLPQEGLLGSQVAGIPREAVATRKACGAPELYDATPGPSVIQEGTWLNRTEHNGETRQPPQTDSGLDSRVSLPSHVIFDRKISSLRNSTWG